MKIQTLVVTTAQQDRSLPEKMNLRTDAVIGSQCGKDQWMEFEHNGHKMQYIYTSTTGVGINRNETLFRAEGDFCVLADDDMTFLDGYENTVQEWFEKVPRADMLIFNLEGGKKRYRCRKVMKINWLNYGKFGAARLAFRLRSVRFSGVTFHTMFGGGGEYSCGEDTLFLRSCLREGLKIYGVPASLAQISDDASTWFQGYTDKYFFDKGVLYYALNCRLCKLHALIHCLRYRSKFRDYGFKRAFGQMIKGMESVK